MARNLYKTAGNARKILITLIILALLITGYDTVSGLFDNEDPLQTNEASRFYMTADRSLGDVPKPEIPGLEFNREGVSFLNVSVHDVFPDVSYVYKLEEPAPKLNALDNARPTIFNLGFESDEETQVDTNLYEWANEDNTKKITYNTLLRKWALSTDFSENEQAQLRKNLFDNLEEYSSKISNAMARLDFVEYGFEDGIIESTYASIGTNELFIEESTSNNSEYVFAEVFRQIAQADLKPSSEQPELTEGQVKSLPTVGKVYSDDPRFGQIHMIISNQLSDLTKDIFELKYTNYEYNEALRGSYLIITPNEAWNNISNGDGSLVYLRPQGVNYFYTDLDFNNITEVTADFRNTELAFWEPTEYDGYVYPIYVFKGTAQVDGRIAEFTIFVDAIKRV
jgi:hypothetical protein